MLREYLGEFLTADPTTSNEFNRMKRKTNHNILSVLIENEKSLFKVVFWITGFPDLDLKCFDDDTEQIQVTLTCAAMCFISSEKSTIPQPSSSM